MGHLFLKTEQSRMADEVAPAILNEIIKIRDQTRSRSKDNPTQGPDVAR